MVSNGLVVTGVLVLVSQMVFVSKVPKCLESAEMQGGICPSPYYIRMYVYIYIRTTYIYIEICISVYMYIYVCTCTSHQVRVSMDRKYVCMHVCIHVCICIQACISRCTYIYTPACIKE